MRHACMRASMEIWRTPGMSKQCGSTDCECLGRFRECGSTESRTFGWTVLMALIKVPVHFTQIYGTSEDTAGLCEVFPRVQFIATTHSPYILNSIANAKAYDLENCVELENPSRYSSEGLAARPGAFSGPQILDVLSCV